MRVMGLQTPVAIGLVGVVAVLSGAGAGCSGSQPEVDPYEAAEDGEEESESTEGDSSESGDSDELLDADVGGSGSRRQTSWGGDISFSVDEPPAEPSKEIDGEFDDWETSFKTFEGRSRLVEGEQFWDGASDASMRVAAKPGRGYLYFAVEVTDDRIIDAESVDPFADGVVLWLRDPGLVELRGMLPESFREGESFQTELGILFTPDGQYWRRGDRGNLYREGIDAATKKTDSGYQVEVALQLGTLRQLSELPLRQVAFRVELIDGDEPERRGVQTTMTTIQPGSDGEPRWALLDLPGWLPHAPLQGGPPREGALGRWQMKEGSWTFESFEVVPSRWRLLRDSSSFEDLLNDGDVLGEVCSEARNSRRLVEGFEDRRGRHRVALVICGTRASDGECPDDATTRLFWVHLKSGGDAWSLEKALPVTDAPLEQCADEPSGDAGYHHDFSFTPLEMMGPTMWAVGWFWTAESESASDRKSGVWFLNTEKEKPNVGRAQTYRREAESDERTVAESHVYLTRVDDVEGWDICEVERISEQECSGLNEECEPEPHGQSATTHIRMWRPEQGTFERYVMSKHRNCRTSFDFSQREAYMLFHRQQRLGLIASDAL